MNIIKLVCLLSILLVAGCKKEGEGNQEEGKNSCGKALSEIVPNAYLNKVKENGFTIHLGSNPPDISGTWRFAPWRLDVMKMTDGGTEGTVLQNGLTATFSSQTATSIDVKLTGFYQGFENCKPWIMGSGNNFTICLYIRMDACAANFRYNYMRLISGTKDGNVLRSIKMATIGLDALSSQATCDMQGGIEIWSDTDGASQPE
ncbi:MAG: hypothetical protein QM594_12740 [Niabella sp.]